MHLSGYFCCTLSLLVEAASRRTDDMALVKYTNHALSPDVLVYL
jgi:hypothetical protein